MRRAGIWRTAAVVLATAVVTGVWGHLLGTWPPAPPASTVSPLPPAAPSSPPVEEVETVAVVLGDAFSVPTAGVPPPAWPALLGDELGWDVTADAVPGSGYLAGDEGETFPDRVDEVLERSPDVVVLAGGISDLGRPAREAADTAEEVVVQLGAALPEAQVVVLSPFSDGPPGVLTTELAGLLEQVAERHGARYVDVTGLLPRGQGQLADDGVHPSREGHQAVAEHLAARLSTLPGG